ncbi:MAG: sigma 54-dependent Fis family transcriptional regulator [Kofleriaceae bacterium]|nr:sigma 54-dependent Fis family transcriptional regulator [Kofleriaceae bacterium]MCL4225838.1 sigma 54-interacting transcriptional regulator [Myxococcales bacterium]
MPRHDDPLTLDRTDVRSLAPVVALRNRSTGKEITIGDRRLVVGKSASCDVVLDDPCVSRVHCVLEPRDGALFVRDKRSRNGTYVNDRRVDCGELAPGAELGLGSTRLLALGPRSGEARGGFARLVGRDPAFLAAIDQARRIALTDVSVLIVGETGTGKELVAQAIHEASPRARRPFVAVNCGAFPQELIGSELFGHERGAFTGAASERDGVFVQADRGTLFLDELGELPPSQQPHLLRALETRRVRRVGGAVERAFDVRLICATNRVNGLGSERGALRVDLYHRVATVLIPLPPLRARLTDLELLTDDLLEDLAVEHGSRGLSTAARRALRDYRWPGNVRELRQTLTRGVALSADVIEPWHLFPAPLRSPTPVETPVLTALADHPLRGLLLDASPLVPRYDSMVRDAMTDALARHGSVRAAADALGIPRSTFSDRARRLGLPIPKPCPPRRREGAT